MYGGWTDELIRRIDRRIGREATFAWWERTLAPMRDPAQIRSVTARYLDTLTDRAPGEGASTGAVPGA